MVSLLNGQPLSRGQGLQERVRGSQPGHAGSSNLKAPSKPPKIIDLSLQIQFRQGPENYLKFRFFPNNSLISKVIVNLRYIHSMITMGGDLQPGCLADRLLAGLGQPQINP
jgi:hypothetical protein